jgi:REP-associated tyrosine transposase
MPRPPRVEIPFAYYHVAARGNNKQTIFTDKLRPVFLELVDRSAQRYEWRLFAYALMDNHYHLVLQIADRGLSAGMQELNWRFARVSNTEFDRINHCFGKRFWSEHIETFSRLLENVRYVVWNPARAGQGAHPRESTRSSFPACVGLARPPKALAVGDLFGLYGHDPESGREAFERFVSEGHGPVPGTVGNRRP